MKLLKTILLVLIGLYLLGGLLLYFFQEKVIFQASSLPQGHRFEFETRFEEVRLSTSDGASLHALHFKLEKPKGVVLYYHGNRGNLSRWGNEVRFLVDLNYDVIVMDYRGYGKSEGKRTRKLLLSDAQQFYEYTKNLYSEEEITLYGRSLGSGLATYVASQNQPKRLILETPYYNFRTVIYRFLPIYPVGPGLRFNFKSRVYIQSVECPITIFHGTEDFVVPYRFGKKLYESIPHSNKGLVTIVGGGHRDLGEFEEFQSKMMATLN